MAKTGGGRGLRGGVGVGTGVNRNFNMGLGGAAAALSAWLMSQKENISNMDMPDVKFPTILSNPQQKRRPEILTRPISTSGLGILSTPATPNKPIILSTPIEEQVKGLLSTPATPQKGGIVYATTEQVDNPFAIHKRGGGRTNASVLSDRANQGTRRRAVQAGIPFTEDMKLSPIEYAALADRARQELPSGEKLNQTYVDRIRESGKDPARAWEAGHPAGVGFAGKPDNLISFDLNQLENQARAAGVAIEPGDYGAVISWALEKSKTAKPKNKLFSALKGKTFEEAVSWLGAEHLV